MCAGWHIYSWHSSFGFAWCRLFDDTRSVCMFENSSSRTESKKRVKMKEKVYSLRSMALVQKHVFWSSSGFLSVDFCSVCNITIYSHFPFSNPFQSWPCDFLGLITHHLTPYIPANHTSRNILALIYLLPSHSPSCPLSHRKQVASRPCNGCCICVFTIPFYYVCAFVGVLLFARP